MAEEKMSAALDRAILATVDAKAASLINRSEPIQRAPQNEHLRMSLERYTIDTVPTLGIDAYANAVYEANRTSGL